MDMARKINAIKGGKINIQDDVEEIYERKVVPYGSGANVIAPKKYIGKKAIIVILKDLF